MPVYTYRCSSCGVQFDKQQSFHDQSLLKCPECGKKALKKIYLPVGIVFKGSGFYATDHHSPSGQSPRADEPKKADSKEDSASPPPKETTEKAGSESDKKAATKE